MYFQKIRELTAKIVEAEEPEGIILFGSYASGTATEDSDVDLLVISRSILSRREREVRLTRRLFGSGVPYDLVVLTPEEVEERLRRKGRFIQEILSSGQVLYHAHDAGLRRGASRLHGLNFKPTVNVRITRIG